MNQLNTDLLEKYIKSNIAEFHAKRTNKLRELKLREVLKKKNPYLFKAKGLGTAESIVKSLIEAYMSSSEESKFGEFLEGLAVYVCQEVYHGWKSGIKGIDLEFDKDEIRYIISIKSGPNWANAGQIEKMINNFRTAIRTLNTNNKRMVVIPINGCCYGRDTRPFKKDLYYKYCGQQFWEFISNNDNLYQDIIIPLGHDAKTKQAPYLKSYDTMVNLFTEEFLINFCKKGEILWDELLRYNSSVKKPKKLITVDK